MLSQNKFLVKFYILTSNHIECLKRHFYKIPTGEAVVVINSLDENYIDAAVSFCVKHKIEHYVTESDGTPATGKNSVLKLFRESDNEYMVHIDGDDILTQYGIDLYKRMSMWYNAPDCLVLYRQKAVKKSKRGDWYVHYFPFDKSSLENQNISKEDLTYFFMSEEYGNYSKDEAQKLSEERLKFNKIIERYGESHESMCRIVFFSKKCAEIMNYDNSLVIGEDTIQFLKLKRIALSGGLNMVRYREKTNPTYFYMQDYEGTVKKNNWDWVGPFNRMVERLGTLPEYQSLPEFLDDGTNK